jgi:anti-anti-sigma factor
LTGARPAASLSPMSSGFRMVIDAEPEEVARVIAAFDEFAGTHGLPSAARRSMNVVFDELLANTVSYGLAGRDDGEVIVEVGVDAGVLKVTLTDNGDPFDPFARAAPDTSLSVEDRPIGGLGIHLVRQLVDEVEYQWKGRRNVVVLTKRLEGRATRATQAYPGGRSMEISTRTASGTSVTIVAITGNLDSNTSPQAQQALDAILAGGAKKVAIDFSALDYVSSAGLRVMLGTAKKLTATGGALRTFGLNASVREVFDISGFSTILAVYANEAEALKGF